MPKCIAIEWGRNTPCKNEATHLPYNGNNQFCDAHFKNLQLADQNKSKSGVGVKRKDNNVVEVCLDGSPEQNRVIECDQLVQTYRPGSPRPMSPRAPSPRPGSPYIYGNSPKVSSPVISTLQYYSQKPQSPRLLYQTPQPQVVYQNPQVQVGQPQIIYKSYNDNILDNLLQKKPGCNDIETGHECEEDEEDRFVTGRDPRKKRMIRSAPDVERNCNPPFIDFKHNEHIVECLEILDRSKDVKEGLDCINDIINIVEKHPKNKSYNYNVTEVVVDKVAAQLARYMFDADRIELLLTFMFDYESRDLTQKMSFYGFKKDYGFKVGNNSISFLDSSPLKFLQGGACEYFAKPRPVPGIRETMFRQYATQAPAPREERTNRGGQSGAGGSTLTVEELEDFKKQITDDTKREARRLLSTIDEDIKKLESNQNTRNNYEYYKREVEKVNKLPGTGSGTGNQAPGRQQVNPSISSPAKSSSVTIKDYVSKLKDGKNKEGIVKKILNNKYYFSDNNKVDDDILQKLPGDIVNVNHNYVKDDDTPNKDGKYRTAVRSVMFKQKTFGELFNNNGSLI